VDVWLLGLVLRKVAEQPLDQFAKEALFEPLGMQDWEWARFPNGDPNTSGGLHLRPRDMLSAANSCSTVVYGMGSRSSPPTGSSK